MSGPATVARRRFQQLTEESPQNRSERPSVPQAQMLALETGFSSYPQAFDRIRATEEWQQMSENSALHPDQFDALVDRFAADV